MSDSNLGEFLRKEREKRNITLEQIASSTKINIRLLHALEADHYAELPALPFVRGFITAYARTLGLDAQSVLTQYHQYLLSKFSEIDGPKQRAPELLLETREGERTKTMLWLVMGGFIVVGGLIMLFLKPALRHKRQTTVDKLKASHLAEPSPTPSVSATPSPSPLPSPTASVKADSMFKGDDLLPSEVKVKVILRAKEDLWVRYRVDAKESRRFMLRGGTQLVMKGVKSIRLQVGNPAHADVKYRSSDFAPFQDREGIQLFNQTPTLVFPPDLAERTEEPFPEASPLPAS